MQGRQAPPPTQTPPPGRVCAGAVGASVRSLSYARLFATPWTAALQTSLSISTSRSLLRHSNHLIVCWCIGGARPRSQLPSKHSAAFPPRRTRMQHQQLRWRPCHQLSCGHVEVWTHWPRAPSTPLSCIRALIHSLMPSRIGLQAA